MTKQQENKWFLKGGRGSGRTFRLLCETFENKIADIKANCDLAIEGRDVKIMELTKQIEKMKCCANCEKYFVNCKMEDITEEAYFRANAFCKHWELKEIEEND